MMKFLLCSLIAAGIVCFILILFDAVIWRCFQVAFLCFRCKGNGQNEYDSLFDCEECNGSGLLICEVYSLKWPGILWIKPLWFQWKPKQKGGKTE